MAQWPSARRRQRRVIHPFPILTILALAMIAWLLLVKLRDNGDSPVVSAEDRTWLSPELYGARSSERRGGEVVVDRPDSAGTMVLVVAAPGTAEEDWSALQALLERQGVGSVVLAPGEREWATRVRATAERVLADSRRQGRPMAVLTFAAALDSLVAGIPVGHPLRVSPLVVVAPPPFRETGWRELLRKIRPGQQPADRRLAGWTGPVLVIRALDDPAFDSTAAIRLAAAGRGETGSVPGGGYERAPKHPVDYDWARVIRFLSGSGDPSEVVVGADALPSADSATPDDGGAPATSGGP